MTYTYVEGLISFDDVLTTVEKLSPDEQETLVDILTKRITARKRSRLVRDVEENRKEFRSGALQPKSLSEILVDLKS